MFLHSNVSTNQIPILVKISIEYVEIVIPLAPRTDERHLSEEVIAS
jgi:hypothetical protein